MEKLIETGKKKYLLSVLKYFLFGVCLYLFSRGGIKGEIFPFCFGFFIALCWCEQNIFILSPIYILANLLNLFSLQNFLISGGTVVIILICFFIHKRIKVRIPSVLLSIYAILSQVPYLFFNLVSIDRIVPSFVYLFIGILFMFACIKIFKVLLVKGIGLRLTIDECICLCLFFTALGAGLSTTELYGFWIINIISVFFILLSTYIFYSISVPLVISSCIGIGVALNLGSLSYLAIILVLSLSSVAFKSTNKYFSVMAIIITDVVLGLYFNAYGLYDYKILISTVAGELLFLCINNNNLSLLKTAFGEKNDTLALRAMVNRSKDNLCKRMYSLSEVFDEMNRCFKNTITGVLPASEAKQMLKEELFQKICSDCPEKHRCHRVMQKQTDEILSDIISAGLDRGKVSILDIPPFLSTRCNRTNTILNTLNQLLGSYKQYTYCASSVDTSKALIAQEFNGVSKLLLKLADETKELVTFNTELEEKIADDLVYINVLATEVYVYQRSDKYISCTITMRNMDIENPRIIEVLNREFGTSMKIFSNEAATLPNFSIVTYSPAYKYDCVYGSSGVPKFGNEVSGDSFSFIKLNDGKILLSVCDGMGSGEEAQKMSDTTISLIENFYKADFDDETILASVNKLLTMQMVDNYSAVDICVLDLNNALGDFVKVGAPVSFIKKVDSTEYVEGVGALPVGILEDIKPSINKKILDGGDMIILLSDGVVDSFGSNDTLQNFINNQQMTNPQELSDEIIKKAVEMNSNEPKDDLTVLCVRIYESI